MPDGKLASGGGRVVKNVSGYDMMKLHYGALGSLGVIVAASFKVFPKPLHDVTVANDGGWEAADEALSTPLAPSAVELSSDGRVLARFLGSPEAVDRVVSGLEWDEADSVVWEALAQRPRKVGQDRDPPVRAAQDRGEAAPTRSMVGITRSRCRALGDRCGFQRGARHSRESRGRGRNARHARSA